MLDRPLNPEALAVARDEFVMSIIVGRERYQAIEGAVRAYLDVAEYATEEKGKHFPDTQIKGRRVWRATHRRLVGPWEPIDSEGEQDV